MPFGVLNLIDADRSNTLQLPVFQSPTYDILNGMTNLLPRSEKGFSSLFPGQFPRPMRQKLHISLGQLMLATGPGNLFHFHATTLTVNPPHAVKQKHKNTPQGNEFKPPFWLVVVSRGRLMATRANHCRSFTRPDFDFNAGSINCAELSWLIHKTLKVMATV